VEALERMINTSSKPGQIILDPFMGSGSTGIACLNTSRDFIGIEKDPGYFEIAKNRIEEHEKKMKEEMERNERKN
jgi:site-specific DNA-methyltransferase (adenine-specific)